MDVNTKRTPFQIMQDVLFALVLREYLTRFGQRRMGAFWELFEPVVHIGIMMFIFTVIRARSIPGIEMPLFLLTGMIPFFLMRNIIFKLMDSVSANKALFSYPNITIFDTYLARSFVECTISSTVYILFLFIFGFWFEFDVSVEYPIEWFTSIFVGVVMALGLGITLSIVTQIFPNAKFIIRIGFIPVYLMSGVIFPLWIIPEKYLPWVLWNPLAHIVSNIREGVFAAYPHISGVSFTYPLICTVCVLFISLGLYRLRRQRLLTK